MPLVLISGLPCSGKSTRSQQLLTYLSARPDLTPYTTHLITSPTASEEINPLYRSASAEKTSRSLLSSAIKRHLTKTTIVVADAPNFIKGFRYQLFCEAKAALTPSCVVHVAAPAEKCIEWNSARRAAGDERAYDDDVMQDLIFRYEEPDGRNRWDKPCFVVPWMDSEEEVRAVWERVWDAVSGKAAGPVKANLATVLKAAPEGDHLYVLDKVTQEVVGEIMENQRAGGAGRRLKLRECEVDLMLPDRQLPMPQLQRLRRQFIQLNRAHLVGKQRLRELFAEYLNTNLS